MRVRVNVFFLYLDDASELRQHMQQQMLTYKNLIYGNYSLCSSFVRCRCHHRHLGDSLPSIDGQVAYSL